MKITISNAKNRTCIVLQATVTSAFVATEAMSYMEVMNTLLAFEMEANASGRFRVWIEE